MQDMTSEICKDSSVATGSAKQLRDSRDGKYYWIAKLADGNCWMTQNLDFDIPTTLYSTTSNVSSASVSTGTTKVTTPGGWSGTAATYNTYYDPGDYMYNGPSNNHAQGTACNVSSTGTLASCNQFATTVANTNALGSTNNHYHVGNYYSWPAATVKSGDSLTAQGTSAPDSICPKGWQLPTNDSSTQFISLFAAYGITNGDNITSNVYGMPMYFVYGGVLGSSALNNAGDNGYYWSSTVSSSTNAFILSFASRVGPAGSNVRYYGFSVRCVAE